MKQVTEMTLEEVREELARRILIEKPTEWQYRREQLLVERIHAEDPAETISQEFKL